MNTTPKIQIKDRTIRSTMADEATRVAALAITRSTGMPIVVVR